MRFLIGSFGVVVSLAVVLRLFGAQPSEAAPPAKAGKISVKLAADNSGALELQISLKSGASNAVDVLPERLPWNRDGLRLYAVPKRAALPPMTELRSLDYWIGSSTVISPSKEYSGAKPLEFTFPKLREVLKESDVVLLWICDETVARACQIGNTEGVLVIPKTK